MKGKIKKQKLIQFFIEKRDTITWYCIYIAIDYSTILSKHLFN